jgi:hypothetical protein
MHAVDPLTRKGRQNVQASTAQIHNLEVYMYASICFLLFHTLALATSTWPSFPMIRTTSPRRSRPDKDTVTAALSNKGQKRRYTCRPKQPDQVLIAPSHHEHFHFTAAIPPATPHPGARPQSRRWVLRISSPCATCPSRISAVLPVCTHHHPFEDYATHRDMKSPYFCFWPHKSSHTTSPIYTRPFRPPQTEGKKHSTHMLVARRQRKALHTRLWATPPPPPTPLLAQKLRASLTHNDTIPNQ